MGMTRAMERLFLTWAQSRQVFGQRRLTEPSRFLTEIPREQRRGHSGEAVRRRLEPAPCSASRARAIRPSSEPLGSAVRQPTRARCALACGVRHPLFGVGTIVRTRGHRTTT